MNMREALERIAKYPMSRSDEMSIETAREIARAALASQAQQSQWISVEERLPEGDVFVDVYIRSRSNTNFMQRETSVAFVSGKFKINRIFDCEYVSHWMPIPPAPEGGE